MANETLPDTEKERTALARDRETSLRATEVAHTTILKLEKKIRVLEAQVDELRMELDMANPKLPQPKPMTLAARTTAFLVVDMGIRCADPRIPCHRLVPGITESLKKARAAGVFVAFTGMDPGRTTPDKEIYPGFTPRPDEPLVGGEKLAKEIEGSRRFDLVVRPPASDRSHGDVGL